MKTNMKMLLPLALAIPVLFGMKCTSNADTALHNVSTASEQFEVMRRVTFVNVIQDVAMLSVEGLCSVEFRATHSEVICLDENDEFRVNKMEKSDNTTMVVEQLAPVKASVYQYRFLVKPSLVIPDFDIVVPGMEGNS